jgi:hypothetical protein
MLGRIGNNLFQYALGRVLSEKHGVPLLMDGSWFNREGWSQVSCIKGLPGPAAGKAKVVRRCSLGARVLLKATGRHYWEYRGVPVLRESESDQSYDPRFHEAPADCMLFGYFQTPCYFQGMETVLRGELSTRDLGLEIRRESLAEKLRGDGSVAVHVRRGDYTGNPNLDLCGMDYYRRAMDRMRESLEDPRFFVFSDDPGWCVKHFSLPDVTIIRHSDPVSPMVDLHLMSLAGHHVIANSSFSWWAAWLGEKPNQRVLMPSKWFARIHSPIEEKRQPHWEIVG